MANQPSKAELYPTIDMKRLLSLALIAFLSALQPALPVHAADIVHEVRLSKIQSPGDEAGGIPEPEDTGNSGGANGGQDWTAPIISAGDVTVDTYDSGGAYVYFSAYVYDDTDPNPSVSTSPSSGTFFSVGSHYVTVYASDASGNSAVGYFVVTVNYSGATPDVTPPVIVAPNMYLTSNDPAGMIVFFDNITVTDDTDPSPTWSTSPLSGTYYQAGITYYIAVYANDASGNHAETKYFELYISYEDPYD